MAVTVTLSVFAVLGCALPALAASQQTGDHLHDFAKPVLRVLVKPAALYSHWAHFAPITSELVARGHDVQYLHSDQEVGYLQGLNLPVNTSFQFKQPHSLDEMLVRCFTLSFLQSAQELRDLVSKPVCFQESNSAERMGASVMKVGGSVFEKLTDTIAAPLQDPEVMSNIRVCTSFASSFLQTVKSQDLT